MVPGQYHTWPKAMTARNAAVQRLSRNGGVTSAAKALPRFQYLFVHIVLC